MEPSPKKIAYLFGAGSTHAELAVLNPDWESKDEGLLISHVSKRVMLKASRNRTYLRDLEMVSGTSGSLNIELLISLIESSKIHDWSEKTDFLKTLVRDDIRALLPAWRTGRFFLHKGLLELHQHKKMQKEEEVIGLITVNYDGVLDRAYKTILGNGVNYCFSRKMDTESVAKIPLLKLHGSFNWSSQLVLSRRRDIDIIPLGSAKSYLHAPYGFIWSRALDLLSQCDSLRIVGCSLSPNDVHLIDLLFKAHLERRQAFDIEIIASDRTADAIKHNYGFFRNIKRLSDLGVPSTPVVGPPNPFLTWLKYTAAKMLSKKQIEAMPHLNKVLQA